MRGRFLLAVLIAAPLGLSASPASADLLGFLFGGPRAPEGRWCAHMNAGLDHIEKDCTFNSFEACRRLVTSGNRGFCVQNPNYTGRDDRSVRRKGRRFDD
jgi:hypothetical protein